MSISLSERWRSIPDINGTRNAAPPVKIIWVDPGLSTGWAVWYPEYDEFHSEEGSLYDACDDLSRALEASAWIGWESFTTRPGSARMSQDNSAPEVIGALKWLAYRHYARVLRPQDAAGRSLGAIHVKRLGWYRPGMDDANSAAAHMLTFALKSHVLPENLLEKLDLSLEEK